ncbi:TRAF2 and NCK interacting kinase b isoform X2, partial [Tachysurus ichikawai]
EYKRKQLEEQRQAERLQRQLQQERAYLVSLQQQQQQEPRPAEKKQLYHYKDSVQPSDKPAWAKEVVKRAQSNSPRLPTKNQYHEEARLSHLLLLPDPTSSHVPSRPPSYPAATPSHTQRERAEIQLRQPGINANIPRIRVSCEPDLDQLSQLLPGSGQEKRGRSPGRSGAWDSEVEERSKLNRQSSPALQHKVANRISDPSLPPRSESFSSGGIQQARTPPMHRSVEPQMAHLVSVKSHGSSMTGSQSLHDQSSQSVSAFQESLSPHRPPMPRQNSDPTSETPMPPPRITSRDDKFDRSSWLRQEEEVPPKVPQRTTSISPALVRKNSPGNGPGGLGPRPGSHLIRASNPDLRVSMEPGLPRTSSGSSSSSSTPSSQGGSSERNRVGGSGKPESSPSMSQETKHKNQEESREVTRPSRPALCSFTNTNNVSWS